MLVFGWVILLIIIILNRYLKKKFNINEDNLPFRSYSNLHKWLERILFLGFAILFVVVNYLFFDVVEDYLFFGFGFILFATRAFMEYKFDREDKQYLLTLVWAIGLLVMFVGSNIHMQQTIAPYKEVVE
ncbi:DUF4181 domain-containing protein [Paucisalibacillus globulus]|uniref:DUF4181 domain-containing protein n=1 Tax=Paucisalibacillus globulus TaxID=351095 RepID=UPI0004114067|nr:DUF4181 domain-containing protein [Paucisalibacillus globulus]